MDPDGDIMIHGLKDGVRRGGDWTQGCIAVTAEEMDEIWGLVGGRTAVWMNRMTKRTLADRHHSQRAKESRPMWGAWIES